MKVKRVAQNVWEMDEKVVGKQKCEVLRRGIWWMGQPLHHGVLAKLWLPWLGEVWIVLLK